MGISVSTDNENIHDLNSRRASALHLFIALLMFPNDLHETRSSVRAVFLDMFLGAPKFTLVSNLMDKCTEESLDIFLMADFPAVGLKKEFHKFPKG